MQQAQDSLLFLLKIIEHANLLNAVGCYQAGGCLKVESQGIVLRRFHPSYSGSLHNDELRLPIVKAQTTSERQANQSINLTANGRVNVIALRSTDCQLNLYHTSEMEDITMPTSDDRSIRLHRWREKKEQEDLQMYGKHRRVSTTLGGSFRAKKQKMASSLRHEVARAQPHPSLHRHLTQVYRLCFYPIASVRY